MSAAAVSPSSTEPSAHDKMLFWGCFIALITTSFAFMGRVFLIGTWQEVFELDKAQAGRLLGIGIWPFAVSIILFSLFIDKIGYKTAMFFAFAGHLVWTVMAVAAYFVEDKAVGFNLLYWGSLICALANGTVEAFINPVVATMFSREKTKWLNILHAGWPAGLVITGLLLIGFDSVESLKDVWAIKVGVIGIPMLVYFFLLVGLRFPESERVKSGVSYREMLQEFGVAGAVIVGFLLVLQLMDFFSVGGTIELSAAAMGGFIGIGILMVAAFGLYTRSIGRPLLFFLILIMMPLATTEIGTDGWITGIMEGVAKTEGFHAGWILVYTSAIMLILRFFAGPIVHTLSPLGLLATSAILAIGGLWYLSTAQAIAIFFAATLYGFGKTFFWPTMLGVVSEQCPKGGALTLNAISGIGMLAVGTLGTTYIGALQADKQIERVAESQVAKDVDGLVVDGKLTTIEDKEIYEVIQYRIISDKKLQRQLKEKEKGDPKQLAEKLRKQLAGDKELKSVSDGDIETAIAYWKQTPSADDEHLKQLETIQKKRSESEKSAQDKKAEEDKKAIILTGEQEEKWKDITKIRGRADQGALAGMTVFPAFMLACYIILIIYFRTKGGYAAEELTGHAAEDEKFTGGVEGAVE